MEISFMMILNVSKLVNTDPNKLGAGNFNQRPNLTSVRCFYQVGKGCEKEHRLKRS
jgi:hypothetical protein